MIAQRLKALCKQKGITQKELAARLGITPVALSKSINSDARISTLKRIAAALNVSLGSLCDDETTTAAARCPNCGAAIEIALRQSETNDE